MARLSFFSLDILYLLKELANSSLCHTLIDLACKISRNFPFITLHSKRFTRARLPICYYSSVITLHDPINEPPDSQSFVNVFLILLLCEYLIKLVSFSSLEPACHMHTLLTAIFIALVVCNFNVFLVPNHNFCWLVALLLLVWKHRSNPDTDFDASIFFTLSSFRAKFCDSHSKRFWSRAYRTNSSCDSLSHELIICWVHLKLLLIT